MFLKRCSDRQYGGRFCSRLAVCLALMVAAGSARAQLYLVTDLGTNVVPQGINNNGDIVGYVSGTNYNTERAFFFTNGVATTLSFGGGTTNSTAYAINTNGQSVGWYQDSLGAVHCFLSTNSATLGDIGVGAAYQSADPRWNGAVGINDAGQILGTRPLVPYPMGTTPRAFLIANGQTNDLPIVGGATNFTTAGALSQSGAVAYMAATNYGASLLACLYTNGVMTILPTPTNTQAYVGGINDSNQVVGYLARTTAPYGAQAFFYDGQTLTNIGGFGTTINVLGIGINNYGQVVGVAYATNQVPATNVCFIYDATNGVADLNTLLPSGSGWTIIRANGINDPGQIIGVGAFQGAAHGCLLTPGLFFNPKSVKYNRSTGTFTFTISGLNGQTIVIQASCDLMAWASISTNVVNSRGGTTFTDPNASICSPRYYRAVILQ